MGRVAKCFMIYEKPFWRELGFSGQSVSDDKTPFQTLYDCSPADASKGILMGFVVGSRAEQFFSIEKNDRKVKMEAILTRYFGEKAKEAIEYQEFSMNYISQICDAITEVPVTVFAKGAFFAREEMAKLNCDTIGLDWNMGIEESRKLIGPTKTLQGNLDPAALYGNPDQVRAATIEMMDQFKGTRHIANLGHGVYPDIDPEMVKVFIQTVKEY